MRRVKVGSNPATGRPVYKIEFSPKELPSLCLFNSQDVIVGNPGSNIAIGFVYNWKTDSPPEEIRNLFLRLSNYAYLTGYWKTTNGAKYVFANILANPNVNKLLLLIFGGRDNGHLLVDALTCFWKNGTDRSQTIIGSRAPNPRFEQVGPEALERIRKQADLVVHDCITDPKDAEKTVRALYQEPGRATEPKGVRLYSLSQKLLYDDGARFFEPYALDLSGGQKPAAYIQKYSGLALGHTVHADSLAEALEMVAAYVYEKGEMLRDQRGIVTMESRSFSVTIRNALSRLPDGFSLQYLEKYAGEFLGGVQGEFAYSYHDRIFRRWGNQVDRAVLLLKKSPQTRRCLISLWDPACDLETQSPPCLDFLWFVIRSSKLEMHAVYRSHHLATVTREGRLVAGEGAFVPNMYALAKLQESVAGRIGKKPGPIALTDFSGHLYMSEL